MFVQRFVELILRKRWHAMAFAVLFAVMPFLGWISGVIVGLVTLRKGAKDGFLVLLWAILPNVVMVFVNADWIPFMVNIVYGSFLVWVLAVCLRMRLNWTLLLYITTLFGVVGVITMHLVVNDVAAWWINHFKQGIDQFEQAMRIPAATRANVEQGIQLLSMVATGLPLMMYSLAALVELLMARGLDAALGQPELLAQGTYRIRMNVIASVIFIACLVVAHRGSAVMLDMLPVLLLPFVLAGISLIHCVMAVKKMSKVWYVSFYTLVGVAIFFMPALLLLLVVMALADSVINLRKHWLKFT